MTAFAAVGMLAGCRGKRQGAQVHVERDELGRDVAFPHWPARRVVSLATSTTEILFSIGAGATVVGADVYADWPAAVATVPRVGTQQEPSVEAIVGLRPDVVVTAVSANRQSTVEAIERLGGSSSPTSLNTKLGRGRLAERGWAPGEAFPAP